MPGRAEAAVYKAGGHQARGLGHGDGACFGRDGICKLPRGEPAACGCARRVCAERCGAGRGAERDYYGAFRQRDPAAHHGAHGQPHGGRAGKAVYCGGNDHLRRSARDHSQHAVHRRGKRDKADCRQSSAEGRDPCRGGVSHRARPRADPYRAPDPVQRDLRDRGRGRRMPVLCRGTAHGLHHHRGHRRGRRGKYHLRHGAAVCQGIPPGGISGSERRLFYRVRNRADTAAGGAGGNGRCVHAAGRNRNGRASAGRKRAHH